MNQKKVTVGSVCSGIEAASVAWSPQGMSFEWFSEIADFPSKVLAKHYPEIPNIGDMTQLPRMIEEGSLVAPDIICGGTPCQAFSLAGWKHGLEDDRGNLTLRFVDIVEANDRVRSRSNLDPSIVFWENVEGVLTDKTNAFGCLIASLAGFEEPINRDRWASAGLLEGPRRNVAWRVLDAKYFGLPQQRRRLYLVAGGKNFHPENVLFEPFGKLVSEEEETVLSFHKNDAAFEVFREYTDCLYSAYGTKWNGNAAAYNGSLYVMQDGRIRRLSPIECERLMGFPDGYTDLPGTPITRRYQALGNSWAVPVVSWLGGRFVLGKSKNSILDTLQSSLIDSSYSDGVDDHLINPGRWAGVNYGSSPNKPRKGRMQDIVDDAPPKQIYISPTGCYGIIRRKNERNLRINPRLEQILLKISSELPPQEIEKRSRVQRRGKFSDGSFDATQRLF